MKCLIVVAVLVAVASAQFGGFGQSRLRPTAYPRPSYSTPKPFVPAQLSRVSSSDQAANIVSYENEINPDGSYRYAFQTDNGIAAQAQGTPRDFGGNPPVIPVVAQGSYSYTSPEGQLISITYIADENGYQPQGDSLPTSPPIPPQIARALEWIARNAPRQ